MVKKSISTQKIISDRIEKVSSLNSKYPNWNNQDTETARACLDHLSDYQLNKEAFKTLLANIKDYGNTQLSKKAQKFAEKKGLEF